MASNRLLCESPSISSAVLLRKKKNLFEKTNMSRNHFSLQQQQQLDIRLLAVQNMALTFLHFFSGRRFTTQRYKMCKSGPRHLPRDQKSSAFRLCPLAGLYLRACSFNQLRAPYGFSTSWNNSKSRKYFFLFKLPPYRIN
jgi:hypothetical protein